MTAVYLKQIDLRECSIAMQGRSIKQNGKPKFKLT